ncbi:Transporter aclS [Lachnellula suecica]|uniref:Transporter aclS n=1 Tax=Lachnellula suecica TaxID=602035 RepID=A0A8T9C4T5_9HELO|nr:Transporter aclS [Lachnellula suecica]
MKTANLLQHLQVSTSKGTHASPWINDDIRPMPPSRRQWGKLAFISFWAINQICLSNWQVGASLVAVGLSVWQAMVATIIGKVIISAVAISNGYVGAEWHIGFPVYARVIWGMYGSYLALLQRILLGLVWFSVQSWTGGLYITAVLGAMFPSFHHMKNTFPESANMTTTQFVGWVVYNLITIPMLYLPPDKTKKLFIVMNAISLVTLVSIMIRALSAAHGAGPLLSATATATSGSDLGWAIVKGVTTVIGSIAVGLTNQPDYSRFARNPGDQVFGQWFSIMSFGTVMPLFGCLTSSATQALYGEAIWNPPNIVLEWLADSYSSSTRAAAFFAGVGLVVCQLAINTIDNSFSTGMDLSGLFPKYINIRRGAYIGLDISIAMCPWELLSSAGTFINVMSAYSVFLGPMCGIQICHYWLICHRRIKLSDLYDPHKAGIYYYSKGFNYRSFVAWVVGWATQMPGFINAVSPNIKVQDALQQLSYLAFPLGFVISFLAYWVLNKIDPPRGLSEMDDADYFGTFTLEEAAKLGLRVAIDIEGEEVVTESKEADAKVKSFV